MLRWLVATVSQGGSGHRWGRFGGRKHTANLAANVWTACHPDRPLAGPVPSESYLRFVALNKVKVVEQALNSFQCAARSDAT